MTRERFPWVALGVGLILAAVLVQSGATEPATENALPLLTLLLISELGFLVTAAGALAGTLAAVREGIVPSRALAALGCAVLAVAFLIVGIGLWPGPS
jgi:hypothetical protein